MINDMKATTKNNYRMRLQDYKKINIDWVRRKKLLKISKKKENFRG